MTDKQFVLLCDLCRTRLVAPHAEVRVAEVADRCEWCRDDGVETRARLLVDLAVTEGVA